MLQWNLYPPLSVTPPLWIPPAVGKNNDCIPGGGGPPPESPSPFSAERANRWLSRVASGLCALSVIKGREKVYGLLVSVLPTDGMSSKHPPIPNLQGDVMEGGAGRAAVGWAVGVAAICRSALGSPRHEAWGGESCRAPVAFAEPGRAIKEWVKFKLNIYDAICIMLLPKRLPRWIQIFFCRTLCGSLPSSKKYMQQMWTVLGNN